VTPLALPQPVSRHALGLLHFPDRQTTWVVVLVASLSAPLDVATLYERLEKLAEAVPATAAKLVDNMWVAGPAPEVTVTAGDPLGDTSLDRRFRLEREAPLRIHLAKDGRRLAVAAHHAAFDGLALVAIVEALTGGGLPEPVTSPPPGPSASKAVFAKRLVRPADRIAPSPVPPSRDAYATATVEIAGKGVTGALAAACVGAAAEHNSRLGKRWRRVGISVAKGGPPGVGNVASYRRLDLPAQAGDVADRVGEALASLEEPPEQVRAGIVLALARPMARRLSDSMLVSNLGRLPLPGVERIDFFPVARGRSAVAFGAATVEGGASTVSIRARDLAPDDANGLLESVVSRLQAGPTGRS
jgi:hypothetical protein